MREADPKDPMADSILSPSFEVFHDDRKLPASTYFGENGSPDIHALTLLLKITDRDVVEELVRHDAPEARHERALAALRIGCIALRQMQSKVDTEALRREGDRLISDLEVRLRAEATHIQGTLSGALKEYFDPQGGKLHERIERLIRKDGDLESLLERQIGSQEGSALARTLTAHVGSHSPIMKRLDPAQAESVTEAMRETVSEVLSHQRQTILAEFSLDHPESALNRFRKELLSGNDAFAGDLKRQIAAAVGEFSLDDQDSALSRLVAKVEEAQAKIAKEFSLDDDGSALSRMSHSLQGAKEAIDRNLTLDATDSPLSRLKRELESVLKDQTDANNKFQMEVREALGALVSKRAEAKRSTIHGIEFEGAACLVVEEECRQAGDIATRVGTHHGALGRSKVGDLVIEIGAEHVAVGSRAPRD
jgi:DNA-directed RNA polymerase subunit L